MPRGRRPHLKQRKDGRYRVKCNGKEFYGRSEDEAYDMMDKFVASQATFTRTSVADYAIPWLKRTFPTVSDKTFEGHAIHLQHLVDDLGMLEISHILPSDIKAVYSKHYAGLSNTYILSAKGLYCSLFDSAVADGLIKSNPARAAKPHRGKRTELRVLTKQQREWITTLCVNHRVYPAVMAMLYAGLRPQEAKALDIDRDIDFEHDVIRVSECAHIKGKKYAISATLKTEWSKRTVPLFPPLKAALCERHGPLVTDAQGGQISVKSWECAWTNYRHEMEKAINGSTKRWYRGDNWITFDVVPYTLRHAFCQMCRDAGVEINTCRKWMGHADTSMILKVYDSVSDDRSSEESKKVESALAGVNSEVSENI